MTRRRPARALRPTRALHSAALAVALATAACGAPGTTTEPRGVEASRTGEAPPRPTQRGAVIGGERVKRAVAWPDASRTDALARLRYPAEIRERLDAAPIPVLAPSELPSGAKATASVGPHWYALTVHGDGYLLHTNGSGEARVHPHVRTTEPTHPMRTDGGFLTRNEDIWSASWIEHGVAYSFEVECDRRVVAWCDDEAEILRRVESLVIVAAKGGAR